MPAGGARLMDAFALRIALSFVLGGFSVALFTTMAERMGSRVGGLLLSFPVKVTIAMVLIGLNEGADVASAAATAVPLGIGVNLVFLIGMGLLVRRTTPTRALAGALAAWALVALLAVLFAPARLPWSALAWAAPFVLALAVLPSAHGALPRKRAPGAAFGAWGLLSRSVGAGTLVASAVFLARVGGPLLGGLASVFPSGWMTSTIILSRHHGPEFTAQTIRVMVAGSASPVAFGYAVWLAYPALGVWLGTLAAIGVAAVVALCAAALLRRFSPASARP